MTIGYTTVRVMASGLAQWQLITRAELDAAAARIAAAAALVPADDLDPIPPGAAGFVMGEPVTDLHPIAVLSAAERVEPYVDDDRVAAWAAELQRACYDSLTAGDVAPLTVAGRDYGAPAYRHSPLYRLMAAGRVTEMAAVPRLGTDPDRIAAPVDFWAAPDLIAYRPRTADTTPVTSHHQAIDHLERLRSLCDRYHGATPPSTRGRDHGPAWAAAFAVHADPLINTVRAPGSQPWMRSAQFSAFHYEMVVAALAHHEILPEPVARLARDGLLSDQWLEMRGLAPDLVVIDPKGRLSLHHRHPGISVATAVGTQMGSGGELGVARGPLARLWHVDDRPRMPNPLAERVARALDIPVPAAGLSGSVAFSMDRPDAGGRIPALPAAMTRLITHQLATWRTHGHHSPTLMAPLDARGPARERGELSADQSTAPGPHSNPGLDGGDAGTAEAVNAARPRPSDHTTTGPAPATASGSGQDNHHLPAPDGGMFLGGA
ncbi:hypothetical protein ACWDUL_38420 [Nocardia niigatensis]